MRKIIGSVALLAAVWLFFPGPSAVWASQWDDEMRYQGWADDTKVKSFLLRRIANVPLDTDADWHFPDNAGGPNDSPILYDPDNSNTKLHPTGVYLNVKEGTSTAETTENVKKAFETIATRIKFRILE